MLAKYTRMYSICMLSLKIDSFEVDMENYCIDRTNYEVHKLTCELIPPSFERLDFYAFRDSEAITKVKELYSETCSCIFCMGNYQSKDNVCPEKLQ